jgi:hypothetical protein
MKRTESVIGSLLLVAATVLAVESLHYRLGEPTLWSLFGSRRPSLERLSEQEERDGSVTESEFERYLDVLERMQADHSLPIEQAAESAGLTLQQFRDIEQRVQRNEVLVERTRERLRQKAESLWDSRRAKLGSG